VPATIASARLAQATRSGARLVEAYPVDPSVPGAFAQTGFMGMVSTFRRAGFVDVAEAESELSMRGYTDGNRVMRYWIAGERRAR
jgi:hypothetical protein